MKKKSDSTKIDLVICKDNAISDGNDYNRVVVTITDKNNSPVSNIDVVFKTSGNAAFKKNGGVIYRTTADIDGIAYADVINDAGKDDINEVTAFLFDEQEKEKTIKIHFHKAYEKLSIRSVQNINHTLDHGEPTIVWNGAKFTIQIFGGSGTTQWDIIGENIGILLSTDNSNTATIEITSEFYGKRTLVCTDSITKESVTYQFDVQTYFLISSEKYNYRKIISGAPAHKLLDRSLYNELFRQWGVMSNYPGWQDGVEYWTSEHSLLSVFIYNLDEGHLREVKIHPLQKLKYLFKPTEAPF